MADLTLRLDASTTPFDRTRTGQACHFYVIGWYYIHIKYLTAQVVPANQANFVWSASTTSLYTGVTIKVVPADCTILVWSAGTT
jgi:hypothetical protein